METNPTQPQPEPYLTKRQRREMKKQEQRVSRNRTESRKKMTTWFIWGLVAFVVAGLVWAIIAGGSGGGADTGGDLGPMKADTTDPYLGGQNSPVVVREFSDFQCPACKAAQGLVTSIVQTYGDRIRFDFNDYPLVSIHKNALFAAEAAHCANDQDEFWAFHDKLYDRQNDWANLSKNEANDKFKTYAADLGLDAGTFNACVDSEEKRTVVQEDINQGNAGLVGATPTFFVNDQKIEGIPQEQEFKRVIDEELAKAAAATNGNASDTTVDNSNGSE